MADDDTVICINIQWIREGKMTVEEKKARRGEIRKWIWIISLDIGIVGGYLLTGGVSRIYTNFLTLVHVLCWLSTLGCLLVVILFMFMNVIVEKVGVESLASQGATGQDKMREMVRHLLKLKVARAQWMTKYYKAVIQLGVLIFIGVVMGHWSLFVAYGASWFLALMVTASAAHAYDKAPAEWKGVDSSGDGASDEEAELLRKAEMNPIQLAFENAKEKRAEEKRKKNEAAETLVDSLLEDDF